MNLWWIFSFYFSERLIELLLARRNRRLLLARGGREFYPETFAVIVVLHACFFAALIAESWPWRVPIDALTLFCLSAVFLLQALRYWCVGALGVYWNSRIIVVPSAKVPRRGPYRFIRHPNYLVVTLEFVVLPLLCRAPFTLIVFSLLNLFILRQRITLEEKALREYTDYDEKFSRKPDSRENH
jgi:methyltransferase